MSETAVQDNIQNDQRCSLRRVLIGHVVSDKRDKTIAVEVKRLVKHAKYGKYLYRSMICHAHDEENKAKVGDRVRIQFVRPLSKQKRYCLVEIMESAGVADAVVSGTEQPQVSSSEKE